MESKLVALVITNVYMTNSHCNTLSKQEVFGFNLKVYSVMVFQSTFLLISQYSAYSKK